MKYKDYRSLITESLTTNMSIFVDNPFKNIILPPNSNNKNISIETKDNFKIIGGGEIKFYIKIEIINDEVKINKYSYRYIDSNRKFGDNIYKFRFDKSIQSEKDKEKKRVLHHPEHHIHFLDIDMRYDSIEISFNYFLNNIIKKGTLNIE